MELARNGNCENVDWCSRDMMAESMATAGGEEKSSDDLYSGFTESVQEANVNPLLFCFGQGVAKSISMKQ